MAAIAPAEDLPHAFISHAAPDPPAEEPTTEEEAKAPPPPEPIALAATRLTSSLSASQKAFRASEAQKGPLAATIDLVAKDSIKQARSFVLVATHGCFGSKRVAAEVAEAMALKKPAAVAVDGAFPGGAAAARAECAALLGETAAAYLFASPPSEIPAADGDEEGAKRLASATLGATGLSKFFDEEARKAKLRAASAKFDAAQAGLEKLEGADEKLEGVADEAETAADEAQAFATEARNAVEAIE